jgi:hypothetical protein
MNKKITSEFAIGTIILLAIIVGSFLLLQNYAIDNSGDVAIVQYPTTKRTQSVEKVESNIVDQQVACSPHYYEGKKVVNAWILNKDDNDEKLVEIAISKEDIPNLPIRTAQIKDENYIAVKLVDSSADIKKKLKSASQENPTEITIQGYAEVCTEPPLVSIAPATVAFKKS